MPALRIALLGAESTGKSTLARALQETLPSLTGLRVARVDEYLREWCAREGRTPRPDEQRAIAQEQERRADALAGSHDLVLSDTTALMTALYSEHLFDDRSLSPWAHEAHRRYQLSLLMALDLPWVADGLQRDGPHVREPVDRLLRGWLRMQGHAFVVIQGQGPDRLAHALDALTPLLAQHASGAPPAAAPTGLFSRLMDRQSRLPGSTRWTCELCDDPGCEHALKSTSSPQRRGRS
ncbi:ATP-binding protein [Mitsuaria sp. WAJ17]|uniref:AAA family ATPase n=1 Tax=Mitsuaria sp. WAJ17 TaxID=2761452 RepID=UPI001603793E|nr:ATP-binding protein [Mitsuaria sp. WAJ17]MBB2486302.1 ATP-binding protein [Mitsuaria sp. WAJ17]